MADRAGARVGTVLAAGPAGPARDALLVTRPTPGRRLSELAPFVLPPADDPTAPSGSATAGEPVADAGAGEVDAGAGEADAGAGVADADAHRSTRPTRRSPMRRSTASSARCSRCGAPASPTAWSDRDDRARRRRVVGPRRHAGGRHRGHRRPARPGPGGDHGRHRAGGGAAAGLGRGLRVFTHEAIVAALPFLQRAALDPSRRAPSGARSRSWPPCGRTARRRPASRSRSSSSRGDELGEPRLVVGTLIGGWALIGVLVNVTQSWSTITGAKWGWVVAVFVLAQAVYPALAVTTVGSVTDTMPYGRTVALEVSNTFVSLAGGSMGALATRVRFFQQQGYDATLAVSSGVLISTASWIVKGGSSSSPSPIALSQSTSRPSRQSTGGGSGSSRQTWCG